MAKTTFWTLVRENKKYWLAPILALLVMFGLILLITSGSSEFVYTLF
jgi:hypothetical protein